MPDPTNTLTKDNGYTVSSGKAVSESEGSKITYDVSSGIVEKVETVDDSNEFILEYQGGIFGALPANTLFLLLGLLALPVIRKIKR